LVLTQACIRTRNELVSAVADTCQEWQNNSMSEEEARSEIANAVHLYVDSPEFDRWMRSRRASHFAFEVQEMLVRNILVSGEDAKMDLDIIASTPMRILGWVRWYASYEIGHQFSAERIHERVIKQKYTASSPRHESTPLVADILPVGVPNKRTVMGVELMCKKGIPVPTGLAPRTQGINYSTSRKLVTAIRNDPSKALSIFEWLASSQYRHTTLSVWSDDTIDYLREEDPMVVAVAVMLVLTPKKELKNAIKLFNEGLHALEGKDNCMQELSKEEVAKWLAVFTTEEMDDYIANGFSFEEATILLEQDISGAEARQIINDYTLVSCDKDDDFVDF